MRINEILILSAFLITITLAAGTVLASETNTFQPSSNRSTLAAPTLTVTTSGTTASFSWTSVAGATGYTLSYAPSPYTGPDTIGSIPLGTQTSMSATLWEGAAFFVAVQAYDSVDSSVYSNIEHFVIEKSYTNSLGMTFILLPAGTFTMGSPSEELGRQTNEGPLHQVTISSAFYMQQTEVTQAQWEAVMGSNPSHFFRMP